MPNKHRIEKLPSAVYPGTRSRPPRTSAVRFAERCIQQIGVISLSGRHKTTFPPKILIELIQFNTKAKDGFELVFRSERSARKVLQEIRASTFCSKIAADWLTMDGNLNDAEILVRDCARRIGVEVISLSHVEKVIQNMARRLDAA